MSWLKDEENDLWHMKVVMWEHKENNTENEHLS